MDLRGVGKTKVSFFSCVRGPKLATLKKEPSGLVNRTTHLRSRAKAHPFGLSSSGDWMLKERKRVCRNYTEQRDSAEENVEVQLFLMSIIQIGR